MISLDIFKELVGKCLNINTLVNIINIDANAWIKKYLTEASVFLKFILLESRGIKLIKLNSNPSQAVNHEDDEITKAVLIIRVKKKIKFLYVKKIKKEEVKILM